MEPSLICPSATFTYFVADFCIFENQVQWSIFVATCSLWVIIMSIVVFRHLRRKKRAITELSQLEAPDATYCQQTYQIALLAQVMTVFIITYQLQLIIQCFLFNSFSKLYLTKEVRECEANRNPDGMFQTIP